MTTFATDVQEWVGIAEAQERGADNTIPRFYRREVQNKKKTEEEGRPIFDLIPYVEIITPGDKLDRPNVRVSEEHQKRWPAAWAKFQMGEQDAIDGTPIAHWPFLNRAQVAEFKAIGILTVEALANLGDTGLSRLGPGAYEIQKRARQFLKPQGDVETELRKQNQEQADQLNAMQTEIEHLKMIVDGLPKRRGRPRKQELDVTGDDLH